MRTPIRTSRRSLCVVLRVLVIVAVTALASVYASAQTESITDGSTPSALSAGAPAGAYSVSGFETVNAFNGGLNFSLPLLKVSGRGEADFAVTLRIDQKWSISKEINPGHSANFYTRASWLDDDGFGLRQTYSVGKLTVRQGASRDWYLLSPCGYVSRITLARLTFTAPDGTEYELRDKQSNGTPHAASSTVCQPQYNRGKVFVTADGSSATFIADSDIKDALFGSEEGMPPTGVMILKGGTRLHIGNMGKVDWMRDRNGNLITFDYTVTQTGANVTTVTDPLGRTVTITDGAPVVIAYKGFGGADRTVKIYTGQLGTALRSGSTLQTQGTLFPGINNPLGNSLSNPKVITSVELPDSRTYQFKYNSYGELGRVELPTGGAFEYDYAAGLTDGVASGMFDANNQKQVYRRVVERRVYPNGGTGSAYSVKQVYSRPETTTSNAGNVEVRQCTSGPSVGTCGTGAALLSRELHYYYGSPRLSFSKQPYEYTPWQEGKEYKSEVYDSQSGALLRKIESTWEQPIDGATWPLQAGQSETSGSVKPNSPQMTQILTTLADTNQISKQTFSYDQYDNRTDTYEYDYGTSGSGQPGGFLRRTHIDFVTASAYVNADASPSLGTGLRGLPNETWTSSDAAGANKLSRTSYLYDQSAPTDPGVIGHDAAYGAGFMTRGNQTSLTSYLNPSAPSGGVTTTAVYDVAGNLTSTTDARGKTSYLFYDDNFLDGNNGRGTHAFQTASQSAVPDIAGQYGSGSALTSSTKYDFYTGSIVSSTDANGKTTSFDYTDPLDRLKSITRPDGGVTTYTYGQSMNAGLTNDYVRTLSTLDASRSLDSYQFFDGLGRPNRTFLNEGGSPAVFITRDTQYDPLGRAYRASNPYRTNGSGDAVNPSSRWTTTSYDALGRGVSVTTPDGGSVTTSYSGNRTTVTDQHLAGAAGRSRRSVTDALGRLVRADEPDAQTGALDNAGGVPLQSTFYTYDALGNLRKVDQGGQLRFFMYDSLSRLIRVKNPEQAAGSVVSNLTDTVTGNAQWSIAYGYDNNSNMTARVDARGVTTNYTYDNINRNTVITYTTPAGSGAATTPDVKFYYDNAAAGANGMGRLYYSEVVGVASSVFDSYDASGRPLRYHQVFGVGGVWGQPFYVTRTYDKAGNVTAQTYPSGRTVSYTYDAAGRPSSFAGNLGDGVSRTYSTGASYGEFGRIQEEQFGTATPLYNKRHYNVRGQLYDTRLSSVAWATNQWDWNRGALLNFYSSADATAPTDAARALSGPDNNGNLRRTYNFVPLVSGGTYDTVNNSAYSYYQDDYEYDALNRVSSITETTGATGVAPSTPFKQSYTYDRFGNRKVDATQTFGVAATQFELSPATNQEIAEPSNRLYAPGDAGRAPSQKLMRYDPAGNLVYDAHTGQGTRIYDAENRMTQAQDSYQQWSTYTYDAAGQRIKRLTANNETWQIYGLGGELLAEYQAGAATFLATKEYGYRSGELLVTMSSGDTQRLKRFIKNLYYNCLARDPNSTELQQKTDQLAQAGVQDESQLLAAAKSVARGLFESSEYAARNRTNTEYVTDLYNAYLQRAPDSDGLGFWVSDAQNNGRAHTLTSFEVSTEFSTLSATVYGTASGGDNQRVDHFIDEFYLGAYNRFPTTTEKQQQAQRLNNAAAVSQSQVVAEARLMGAEIFQATNYNSTHSDTQYVTDLYYAYLQRAPDGPGMSFWLTKVQNEGRASAVTGFQNSPEFGELAGTLYRETFWLVTDHLGTPRMIADKSGTLAGVKRNDYLPFGEEIGAGTGGRTTGQGYVGSADGVRQGYTSKERDSETGLDYFGARYYASSEGRFVQADSLYVELHRLGDPQQLNLYVYGRNNPSKYTDPTGLDITCDGDRCADYLEGLQKNVSFKIAYDKDGKVVTEGDIDKKKLSKAEKELLKAIGDEKHHVTIHAIDGGTDAGVFFGRSDGNHTGSHTIAFGQTALLDDSKNAGGMTSAQLVGHETLEGYAESKGNSFDDAHDYANQFFGGLDPQPKGATYGLQQDKVVQLTANFAVHGTSVTESITMRFVTPIPQKDFLKGKGAPYPQYPINVEAVKKK